MSHIKPDKVTITCKNCGNSFHGHYCNTCGQDGHTGRIDTHFLYHELQHGLFHIDAGLFYTLRQLFTNPGKAIRLFIEGKRVKHFKPLAFLLVMAGLYAFVNHYFNLNILMAPPTNSKSADTAIQTVNEFTREHFAVYILLELPLVSLMFYLFFKKYGTNYMEQLIINAYLSGLRTFISILFLPLAYYLAKNGHLMFSGIADNLLPVLILLWAYPQYYNSKPAFAIIWRSLLSYILFYILLLIIISLVITLLASFPKLIA